MTNVELIQAIKAEIERLKKEELTRNSIGVITGSAFFVSANELLSFLDSLESEKPMEQDLEKELARFYLKDLCGSGKDEIPEATLHHNFPIMWDDLRDIARHFAQWGAEHAKIESEKPVPADLEEAAHSYSESDEPLYSPGHRFHWDSDSLFGKQIETTFKAGAKWQEEQMLKEAVEGYVVKDITGSLAVTAKNVNLDKFKFGDKVRIVVIPNKDEK